MKGRKGRRPKKKGRGKKVAGRMQRPSKLHRVKKAQYYGFNTQAPPKKYKPAAAAL